ncbi:hypothetical protein [Teichococcus aerofrigidensis]
MQNRFRSRLAQLLRFSNHRQSVHLTPPRTHSAARIVFNFPIRNELGQSSQLVEFWLFFDALPVGRRNLLEMSALAGASAICAATQKTS